MADFLGELLFVLGVAFQKCRAGLLELVGAACGFLVMFSDLLFLLCPG